MREKFAPNPAFSPNRAAQRVRSGASATVLGSQRRSNLRNQRLKSTRTVANRVLNLGGNLSARLASVLTLVQGVLTVQLDGAQNRAVTEAALPRRCSQ